MKQFIFTLSLCLLFWTEADQVWAKPPLENLEAVLKQCLSTHPGTSSEAQCYRSQAAALEKEILRLYAALGGDQNPLLKRSQEHWLQYLASEQGLHEHTFFVRGSQSEWLKAHARYQLLLTRVTTLQRYLDYSNAHQ